MKKALLAAVAVVFGYVAPAVASPDTDMPGLIVVKTEVNAQGQEINREVFPVDFDKLVTDDSTAEEVNALAESTAADAIRWGGRIGGFRFGNYGWNYGGYYQPYRYYNYGYYSYPYRYNYYYNPYRRWGW